MLIKRWAKNTAMLSVSHKPLEHPLVNGSQSMGFGEGTIYEKKNRGWSDGSLNKVLATQANSAALLYRVTHPAPIS